MRTPPPALLPLLRSRLQGEILATTYLSPEEEFSVTDLARRAGASVKAASHEVARLVDAGLLADRRVGNVRLVRRGASSPVTAPLTDLLAVTYGPVPVLSHALAAVPDVERAYIYGSWAARFEGETGPVPNDVDVLVIGTADRDVLDDVANEAQRILGRPVNMRRVQPRHWADPPVGDAFLESVRNRPLVALTLAPEVAAS
jgi:DNA-binding transcriptional ArsR family regulator